MLHYESLFSFVYFSTRTLKGHEETVTAAAFSPDSHYIVTGSTGGDFGGEVMVWDAQYGHAKSLKRVTECHDMGVCCAKFSPTYGSAGEMISDFLTTIVCHVMSYLL